MAPDLYASYHLTKEMHHDIYQSISPQNPDLSVKGKTVLITGGGSGIGLATAKFYAQAGASLVIISGRTLASLETARTEILAQNPATNVITIPLDVSSKESVAALWKEIAEKGLKVDVLVNNAGIRGAIAKIGEGDVDAWWAVQETNFRGVYLMCDGYVRSLSNGQNPLPGTIINIASQMGFDEFPARSAYGVSKHAVVKLAQFVHAEHANIRAFSTHPGIVKTKLSTLGDSAKDTVELSAGLNLYLASPRADYLRGRYVTANWDVDELEAHKEEIIKGGLLRAELVASYGPEGGLWNKRD